MRLRYITLLLLALIVQVRGEDCANYARFYRTGCGTNVVFNVPTDNTGDYVFYVAFSVPMYTTGGWELTANNQRDVMYNRADYIEYELTTPDCNVNYYRITNIELNGYRLCQEEKFKPRGSGIVMDLFNCYEFGRTKRHPFRCKDYQQPSGGGGGGGSNAFDDYSYEVFIKPTTRRSYTAERNNFDVFKVQTTTPRRFEMVTPPRPFSRFTHERNNFDVATTTSTTTPRIEVTQRRTTPAFEVPARDDRICNTRAVPLILNGSPAGANEFPWLVALFRQDLLTANYNYFCTGNLITTHFVLTAAHCVIKYRRDEIVIVAGLANLKNWALNGELSDVAYYQIHPQYDRKQTQASYDLAVVKLNRKLAKRTPVCLWDRGKAEALNIDGMVAGWGQVSATQRSSAVLNKVTMKVVSDETCLRSNSKLFYLTSNMTFCARGLMAGSGPCGGDSGAGLYHKYGADYFLHGIVSRSLVTNTTLCDVDSYIAFTDNLLEIIRNLRAAAATVENAVSHIQQAEQRLHQAQMSEIQMAAVTQQLREEVRRAHDNRTAAINNLMRVIGETVPALRQVMAGASRY